MGEVDWSQVINWIAENAIQYFFYMLASAAGAYVAFQFALKRDAKQREEETRKEEQEKLRDNIKGKDIAIGTLAEILEFHNLLQEIKKA